MKIRLGFVSNSSSSCFVCKTNMSCEEIEDVIRHVLAAYNVMMEVNYDFDTVFGEIKEIDNEDIEMLRDYMFTLPGQPSEFKLVHSSSDNSIPYELHSILEKRLNSIMVHLG